MTSTRKLAELFRAIAAEDMGSASEIAAQFCRLEEKKGHRTVARQLRGALNANGTSNGAGSRPVSVESVNVLSSALVSLNGRKKLSDVALNPSARKDLADVVNEWNFRDKLRELGIERRSKLLFHGPPGCGKSLTAQALGNELGLPVFMVRFDAIIGAFLGQTAIHLRQLFHFSETTPCVLLLDELDALGKKRGNPLDVGELDRIVISLLQELEHSMPRGIVIGTTNLPKHLDDALWRRFDLDISFKAPSKHALRAFAKQLAVTRSIQLPPDVLRSAVSAKSFASAERTVIAEVRRRALEGEHRGK